MRSVPDLKWVPAAAAAVVVLQVLPVYAGSATAGVLRLQSNVIDNFHKQIL